MAAVVQYPGVNVGRRVGGAGKKPSDGAGTRRAGEDVGGAERLL